MRNLLHIDSSVRGERSLSRRLSSLFIEQWLSRNPTDHVIRRDLSVESPPFITGKWIESAFTKPGTRSVEMNLALAASDQLISELENSDIIVIGSPMYNYGMPALLKAWVDQVIRVDRTFSFDLNRGDWPLEPMLAGKELVLITSSGEFGFSKGEIRHEMNHLHTHFQSISCYLGVEKTHHVQVEYQEFSDDRHKASYAIAHDNILSLVDRMSQVAQI